MLTKIRKRDGSIVPFDQDKITTAILKALEATGIEDAEKLALNLSSAVIAISIDQLAHGQILSVEGVQDVVERTLMKKGFEETAKAYILYRDQHRRVREQHSIVEGIRKELSGIVNGYTEKIDWRIRENSNTTFSMSDLQLTASGNVIRYYCLNELYDKEIMEAHETGYIHVHDLPMGIVGYCAGWSLEKLLREGLGGVPGKFSSGPAKHFDAATLQIANFIGTLQQEWAGAQAFSSVDTFLAPFIASDKLCYSDVKQTIQKLIFNLNQNERWGSQTPFTNFTFDLQVPEDLCDKKVIVGGKELDSTYSDYQPEMDMINKAFLELLAEGDAQGRPATFPIPTYNLTSDFDWNSEISDLLFAVTAKYGLPYFQNYINTGRKPRELRSMCCRLIMDQTELLNRPGSLWGPGDATGSIGVVTINVNRLGYEARDKGKKAFFSSLEHCMDIAKRSLEIKRKVINKNLEQGLMPYTKVYLGRFNNHFSTIGLIGMNEACLNFFGKDIGTTEGKAFAIETLHFMRNKIMGYQQETGNLYNLEATPAEGSSYDLALKDKEAYSDIVLAGNDIPYLTNSTHLPVNATDDIFEAMLHQNDIQPLYTGGTIWHAFLGEKIPDAQVCKLLVKRIAEITKLPYFSITPTYSICQDHGYLVGEQPKCPDCGKPTEVWSRVTGYYRPVQNWNPGKQAEFKERKTFKQI